MWFFVPFNHEKTNYLTWEVRRRLKLVLNVLLEYKPKHTQVHWFTTTAEVENKRTQQEWINQRFQGKLANEKIVAFNRAMYDLLKPLLLDTKFNMFGFHNLYNMSVTHDFWSIDGVHYQQVFYEEVVRGILSTHCHSPNNPW